MKIISIDAAAARSLLSYDEASGVLRWRTSSRGRKAGEIAGSVNRDGYRRIVIWGRSYKAHRLAWLCVYGEWPKERLDHRDGNTDNNAIGNLRLASHSQNLANSKLRRDNKVGLKGVSFQESTGRYQANINKDGKRYYLGSFATPEEAHGAYVCAASELFGEFARVS
jgi:hypothetical protein